MNKERLLKLAEFLDELSPEKFDFCYVITTWDHAIQCGSVCCAMGWTPRVFPDLVQWQRCPESWGTDENVWTISYRGIIGYANVAEEIFEISLAESDQLFSPTNRLPWLPSGVPDNATPSEVADSIRRFIAWKEEQ